MNQFFPGMIATTSKTRALVFLSWLGIGLSTLFAFVSLWRGYPGLFLVKLGVALLFFLNMVFLLRSKTALVPSVFGFTLTISLLLIVAHVAGIYALFWINVIPLLAFFLFGLRGGLIANALSLAVIAVFLFFYSTRLAEWQLAQLDIMLSYLLVTGFALFNEKQKELYVFELERISHVDPLTGAYNRRMLHNILSREMRRTERYGQGLSIIMMDLDRYKKINDRHGHKRGDMVLREFADIVRDNIRSSDCFVRFGGDEFVVLAPNTDLAKAQHIADKIRRLVATHDFGKSVKTTVSAGIAQLRHGEREESLLHRADKALYRAKRRGRNRIITDRKNVKTGSPPGNTARGLQAVQAMV